MDRVYSKIIKTKNKRLRLPEEGQIILLYEKKLLPGPKKKDENLISQKFTNDHDYLKVQKLIPLKCKVKKVYPNYLSVTYTDRYNNPQITSFLISDFLTQNCTFECIQE